MAGHILLGATPIGNVGDASERLRTALATADIVAAEDTRRLRELARRLGVTVAGRVVAFHDHNERERSDALVASAAAGAVVLVVSDAGMPAVSDPGYRIVAAAAAAGVEVRVLPGPSAALAGLALSGLPSDRFCFEGFLPRRAGERATVLATLTAEARTMVFFEAPHRLAETLVAMSEAFGPQRRASVSREITKTFEETRRAPLADLARWAEDATPQGEMVIVIEGRSPELPGIDALVGEALARAEGGERLKDAVADLASASGVSSRELYSAAVAARRH